jgi:hypothetical protein
MFSALAVFYHSMTIEVTGEGVAVRGLRSLRMVPFSEIVRIDVKPGLFQTNYAVRARHGLLSFTSLFGGHRRLLELIVERSRLGRL